MKKIFLLIVLISPLLSAQVKQFIWKVGADGKAIPYYQNGKNINLDSAGVYSKSQVDSLIDSNTPDTSGYVASHHYVDSSSTLRMKYSDTVSTVMTSHKVDSIMALYQQLFNPVTCTEFFDDFDSGNNTFIGRYKWGATGGVTVAGVSKINIATGAVNGQTQYIYTPSNGTGSTLGMITGTQPFEFYCGLNANNTANGVITVGLTLNYDTFAQQCFAFVLNTYDTSYHSYWYAGHSNTGVGSYFYSTVAGSTTMIHLKIIFNGTAASYYINGTLLGSSSTNLPTAVGLKPCVRVANSAATARSVDVDYILLRSYNLTRN